MGQGMGQGMGEGMMPGMAGPSGEAGGTSTGDGPGVENAERLQGTGEFKDIMDGESEGGEGATDIGLQAAKPTRGRAWFTSLPQGVRDSVKSRGKATMPKGYEELLRRYFEDRRE